MFGIHDDGVDVDHRADRVQVHRRALLGDRHGEHRVGELSLEHRPGQPLDSGGGGPLPDPDRDHAGREQQHVAAFDRLVVGPVELVGAGEPRVMGVDRPGQRRLALPRRHGQAGDRDLVADPHARVAGEQQVGQRVDHEVVPVHEAVGQPADGRDLLVGQAGHQDRRQVGGVQVVEVRR